MARIEIDQPTPTEPGHYLWQGELSGRVEIIEVYLTDERNAYGMHWSPYLATGNGRHVGKLQGKFSKKIYIGCGHIKELE